MKNAKKLLCLVIALLTLLSMSTIGFVASAAEVDTVEIAAGPTAADDFTWDNATVYFLLTDRFYNGNTANDNSYTRNNGLNNKVAAFQGGDFKGITKKINEGYFDDLGVNAIWVAGWFEQIHGYVVGGDGKSSFPHYAYHGYYGLDFTELDKNYGTEAEFKEMIDAAHNRGIRIVLDVVMNHPGYNTIYDMNEYGFGTLTSDAMNYYNNNKNNPSQSGYHGQIKYQENSGNWAKWWGSDWIRAGLAGYQGGDGSDLKGEVNYLPDFKTESGQTLGIPEILKTKWNKEGTYNAKVSEIDATFKKYNLGSKTVTNYLVAWYAKWVEEYGIDGFRCDTAKHVDKSSWKKLSDTCTQALKNWRQANPSAPGANWDEDFWMTGENFGQGVSKNDYYTNGFDSMINFSFSGNSQGGGCDGLKKASNLNSTYADYANQINNDPNFNVLTYISSHDTGLCRNDLYYQGSALLLMPGGVQIYYGDETNRQYVDCSIHDHENRSFMNWSSIANASSNDAQILAHWQKVGQFRNNHVAVGAGSHTSLTATSGTAFARTYNKNGVNDVVVCVVAANNNTNVTITLGSAFANGATVKNTYTGDTATVQGGKVTFNSGAHGTILIELSEEVKPTETQPTKPTETQPTKPTETQPTKPTETQPTKPTETEPQPTDPVVPGETEYVILGDADLNEKVNVKDATYIQKAVAGAAEMTEKESFAADSNRDEKVNVKDATAIQKYVASTDPGCDVGVKVVYKQGTVEPTEPSNPTNPTEPTAPTQTTDPTEPTTPSQPDDTIDLTQIDGQIICLINSSYGTPYQHSWTDGGNPHNTWPGEQLQQLGQYYYCIIPDEADRIIFNDGGNGQQTDDLTIPGEFAIYDMASGTWAGFLSDYIDVTKVPTGGGTITPPATDPTEPSNPSVPGGDANYVYLRNNAGWSTVNIHYWSDTNGTVWPGVAMESMGNNLYRYEVPEGMTGIVFNAGQGQAQTGDLTVNYGQVYDNSAMSWGTL